MWEMPWWMLIILVAVIWTAMYLILRPLRVISGGQWTLTHVFIAAGLALVSGWLWLNQGNNAQMAMLIGGLWTISGGICLAVVYTIRNLKK